MRTDADIKKDVENEIRAALERNAVIDASRIIVEATGGNVTLKGTIRTWIERREAVNSAWAAPGVNHVSDQLLIRF